MPTESVNVAVQPLQSVTVTLYNPEFKLLMSSVVSPFDQLNVYPLDDANPM